MVKFARRSFMVPVAEFDDFEDFNRQLDEDRRKDLRRKQRVSGNS
jgi:predicted N-acyltransferase